MAVTDTQATPPIGREGRAMLVVFEGIDGSGKTTISNRVAARLAELGLRVTHVRSGGRLASDTAESIRQFTRDQRQVALQPFAELLLYLARESQQLEDSIVPALACADVVIADRCFRTAEVLARFGRGVEAARIAPVIAAASRGLTPDVTILIDVDPQIARARRRAEKIARPALRTSSRKGLSGAGLMQRLRDGYLTLAASEPEQWMVVDNTNAELGALVEQLAAGLAASARTGTPPARVAPAARPARAPLADAVAAKDAFLAWIDDTAPREPEVAAYMLYGLHGDGFDERRRALAARAPAIMASGLRGLHDAASWELRERLAASEPGAVARSLADLPGQPEAAWALRARLAALAPEGVAASLDGLGDDRAWDLRSRLWPHVPTSVLCSLVDDDSPAAWILRDTWLDSIGGEDGLVDPERARSLCGSLRGLASPRAWRLRKRCRAASPVGALLSLEGLDDDRSWHWRERHVARAPRPVLRTLDGSTDARAWALREAALATCKEALDSIVGLDDTRAWTLRHRAADLWPSTVVKSLGELGREGRGRELVERQLRQHPANLSLLKHAAALAQPPVAARRFLATPPAGEVALG